MQFLDERISLIYGWTFYPIRIAFCWLLLPRWVESCDIFFWRKDFENRPNFLDISRVEFCVSFLMGIWFGLKSWASLPSYSSGYCCCYDSRLKMNVKYLSVSVNVRFPCAHTTTTETAPHSITRTQQRRKCLQKTSVAVVLLCILQVIQHPKIQSVSFSCWKVAPHACFDASLVWK